MWVSCNFLRFGCRRVPTVLCLLCYRHSAAWFCSLYPTGRSLECFLIDADATHSGLLMRKAPRTQKFSRHYSLTFVRFAGDAVATRSCSHDDVRVSGSSGLRSGTGSNTREPRYVRNIKTNQAPSTTPHLRPPLRAAG